MAYLLHLELASLVSPTRRAPAARHAVCCFPGHLNAELNGVKLFNLKTGLKAVNALQFWAVGCMRLEIP